MRRQLSALRGPTWIDLGLGLALATGALVNQFAIATHSGASSLLCGLMIALAVALRTSCLLASVGLTAFALALSPQTAQWGTDPANIGVVIAAGLAFTAAERHGPLATGTAVVVLVASLEVSASYIIPLFPAAVVGAAGVGWIVKSQRRLGDELAARGEELEAEREIFALESVRLERARIAHELHDIVAHCISVLVVQAGAGRRLTDSDPDAAAEALASIAEVAAQAEQEISALVAMLGAEPDQALEPGVAMFEELVERMKAARLDVRLRMDASISQLNADAARSCYRVVQESLTNVLKHSPGAEITISILQRGSMAEIVVGNGPPPGPASGLEKAGAGHGSQGMAQRVRQLGGELHSGPTRDGGWQVRALLPLAV